MGLFGGDTQTATQTVQYLPPQLQPWQQSLQQDFLDWMMKNIGYEDPMLSMLNQYYLGQYAPPPQQAPAVSEKMQEQLADPFYQAVIKIGNFSRAEQSEITNALTKFSREIAKGGFTGEVTRKLLTSNLQKFGFSEEEINNLVKQYKANPNQFETELYEYNRLSSTEKEQIAAYMPTEPGIEEPEMVTPELPEGVPEGVDIESLKWWENLPPESPLGQITGLTPEDVEKKINLQEQLALQNVSDWYEQAQREFQQRGITQHGGIMGKGVETDLGSILSERGRREGEISQYYEALRSNAPYETAVQKLAVLEPLRQSAQQYQLQKQIPWLPIGQSMFTVPYGQQITTTQPTSGVGAIPFLSDIAGIGLGTYGLGSSFGWWGGQTPATAFGAGLTGGYQGGYKSGVPGTPYLGPLWV